MLMITGLLTILFRFVLTVVVANSLHSINLRKNSARSKPSADTTRFNSHRLTSLHMVSSFGLEHRAERVLESFLRDLHSIVGGNVGYFVEKNRFGQTNVISGFAFMDATDGLSNLTIFPVNDATESRKIPLAALEYGLEQTLPVVYDLDLEDEESNDFRICLSDRNDVDSVLILPITSPKSDKQKIIYLENVDTGLSIDSRILDLLSQHLAASLESSILFEQLENINRSLEDEVSKRTAELEQRTLQLEQAKEDALEAANAKSIFLSNMSHEIRTPISQVILASELLTETISSTEGKEYANIITNSGRLLLNLVNDILDFSKLESGKVVLEEVSFNLHGLIQITMDAFNTEKDCRLGHYISNDSPIYVIGDETRLRQILTNLVSNAIKFTNSGYVMLFVTSQLIADDAHDIQFRVVDTGCGIAADKVDKIFGRFEQEDDSITRKFGGTGLGLSICQNLCHLMGSHLSVHSQLDHGSTFSFTVRFQKAVAPIVCSPFFQILKEQPRVLLLERTPPLFESKSVFAYQLETMGCITECCDIQTCHPLATASYELVVVDFANWNCAESRAEISPIFHAIRSSRIPILLTHSGSHDLFVNEVLTIFDVQSSSSNGRIQTLRHPFKQSLLFKVISGLLSQIAMTEIEVNPVEDSEEQLPIPAAHVLPMSDRGDANLIEKLPLEDYKISILLAEDNLINQKIVRTMITQLGYAVDIADDGLIAVKMAREKFYDLILMDVRMPNMDGLEATRQIRSQQCDKQLRTTYIVGLSADVLTSNVNSGLEAGMDLYMSKPMSKTKLAGVIEQVLKRKQD
ncbi:hypothetical protein BKA69DRAFT_1177063 [Paraphysoderma sedebokerense]|nr:hypothetical protein BKA69DRAFT_1179025 [Paraphysoderma sedebokerense]KAI9138901.1 hypothetical protein BKA69DRAFT_1177063 [Paraphysoderma sedebokerense]